MLTRTSRLRAALASALTVILTFTLIPAWAGTATLSGRVLEQDGVTPRSGVTVTLVGAERKEFRSSPTNDEGAFAIEGAPPGTYTLLAQTDDGVFLAAEGLELATGANPPLALTLRASRSEMPAGLAAEADELPTWARAVIIGIIGVAALLVIDEVTEDSEPCASPPCE